MGTPNTEVMTRPMPSKHMLDHGWMRRPTASEEIPLGEGFQQRLSQVQPRCACWGEQYPYAMRVMHPHGTRRRPTLCLDALHSKLFSSPSVRLPTHPLLRSGCCDSSRFQEMSGNQLSILKSPSSRCRLARLNSMPKNTVMATSNSICAMPRQRTKPTCASNLISSSIVCVVAQTCSWRAFMPLV